MPPPILEHAARSERCPLETPATPSPSPNAREAVKRKSPGRGKTVFFFLPERQMPRSTVRVKALAGRAYEGLALSFPGASAGRPTASAMPADLDR